MDKYTLKIDGEDTPRSVFIEAAKGSDPGAMPLTEVRDKLTRYDIDKSYSFMDQELRMVPLQDEARYTLADVLAGSTITLGRQQKKSNVSAPDPATVRSPNVQTIDAPDPKLPDLIPPQHTETPTTSDTARSWSLDPSDVSNLVKGLDLPALLAPGPLGIQRLRGFSSVISAGTPQGQRPSVDYLLNSSTSSSIQARTSKEAFGIAGQVSFSLPYVGASVSAEHDTASASSAKTSDLYFLSELMLPRWILCWEPRQLKLLDPARAAFVRACTQGSRSDRLEQLAKALKTYGAYVGTEVVLGGKLYIEDTQTGVASSNVSSASNSFSAAANLKYADLGLSVSTNSQKGASSQSMQQAERLQVSAIGGAAGTVSDWGQWAASLDQITNWNVVQVSTCIPILALLPMEILGAVVDDMYLQQMLPSQLSGFQLDKYAAQVSAAFPDPFS